MYKILLLGDSLVADYDWQSHLSVYQVYNYGVPGATSADLLASLPGIKEKLDSVDVIMVMIGTNDLLSGREEEIETNLRAALIRLRHDFPGAEVVVNSILPMDLPHLPADSVPDLNSRMEELSKQTGCCFLNTYRRFVDSRKQLFQEDGVHLTPAAYSLWARGFLEHLAFLIDND